MRAPTWRDIEISTTLPRLLRVKTSTATRRVAAGRYGAPYLFPGSRRRYVALDAVERAERCIFAEAVVEAARDSAQPVGRTCQEPPKPKIILGTNPADNHKQYDATEVAQLILLNIHKRDEQWRRFLAKAAPGDAIRPVLTESWRPNPKREPEDFWP